MSDEAQAGLFDVFNAKESQQRKTDGMALAAINGRTALERARVIAVQIATRKGTVTADDVGRVMRRDHGIESLGPAAGALFKGGGFEFTGQRVLSKRKKNNARELKVWRLK